METSIIIIVNVIINIIMMDVDINDIEYVNTIRVDIIIDMISIDDMNIVRIYIMIISSIIIIVFLYCYYYYYYYCYCYCLD